LETTVVINKGNTLQRPIHTTVKDLESIKQIVNLRGLNLEQRGNRAKASSTKFRDVESRTSSPPHLQTPQHSQPSDLSHPLDLLPLFFDLPGASHSRKSLKPTPTMSGVRPRPPSISTFQKLTGYSSSPSTPGLCCNRCTPLPPNSLPTFTQPPHFSNPRPRITHPRRPATYQNLTPE
jgi:hypothetical protein